MAESSRTFAELARRIVEQEAAGSLDPAASAAAVESACRKLREHLLDLLGPGGVAALLKRALHLTQRERHLLAKVTVSAESATCFIGLTESLTASTDEEAIAAAATILTHMLDLLVMLLGEELGIKPVRKLWPQAISVRDIENEAGEKR